MRISRILDGARRGVAVIRLGLSCWRITALRGRMVFTQEAHQCGQQHPEVEAGGNTRPTFFEDTSAPEYLARGLLLTARERCLFIDLLLGLPEPAVLVLASRGPVEEL